MHMERYWGAEEEEGAMRRGFSRRAGVPFVV
jgi:hypothetical protein